MNELQFPGLYIDDSADPRAILPYLRRNAHRLSSGYRLRGNSCILPMDGCISFFVVFLLFPFPCRPSNFLFYPQIISRQRQCTSDQCRDKTQDTGEHTAPTAYVYREYPSAYLSRFVEVFVKSRFGDFAVFRIKVVPVCCPLVAQTIERDSCSTV